MIRIRPTRDDRIRKRGDETNGRIVGITIDYKGSNDSGGWSADDLYAIEVHGPSPRLVGIRQSLTPPEPVRLGMDVALWEHGDDVVIDWHRTCGGDQHTARWKALRRPPERGIEDGTLGLDKAKRKGAAATVTIRSAGRRRGRFGGDQGISLGLHVEPADAAAYDVEVAVPFVPFYASHLCNEGEQLPAWVRPGKPEDVTIDWPAAAMAKPGVGEPTSPVLARQASGMLGAGATPAPTPAMATPTGPGLEPIEGVDFERWVEIQASIQLNDVTARDYDAHTAQFGLAPGAWMRIDSGWAMRLISNPQLGAAYRAAMLARGIA